MPQPAQAPDHRQAATDKLADAIREAQKRSIDQLQRLYALMLGLATSEALRRIFFAPTHDHPQVLWPDSLDYLWVLLSFFFTVVPFYHGNHRYLDDTYVLDLRRPRHHFFLMLDFVAVYFEALCFFGAALFVGDPMKFFVILTLLLVFDSLWVASMKYTSTLTEEGSRLYRNGKDYHQWGFVNLFIVATICLVMLASDWRFPLTCALTFVRTALDYALSWRIYYPRVPDKS